MRRVDIGQELAHDGRLDDDATVEDQNGHEAAGVELEKLGGAGPVYVDDALLERDTKLAQRNIGPVGPWFRLSDRRTPRVGRA